MEKERGAVFLGDFLGAFWGPVRQRYCKKLAEPLWEKASGQIGPVQKRGPNTPIGVLTFRLRAI